MTRKQLPNIDRRRVLQGTGAGLATMMAGCLAGGGGNQKGGGVEQADPQDLPPVFMLTDYANTAWEKQWREQLAPKFEQQTGIGVSVEFSGMSGNQESRLAQLVQAGDPPDINTSTFDQVADVWARGGLAKTNDVTQAAVETNGEMASRPLTRNGNIWQVPHGYYTSDFHYRGDIYEQLGLSVPTSFEGVLDNARAISNNVDGVEGYALAGKKVGKSQDEFQVYLSQMGTSGVGLRWKDPDKRNELEIHFPEDKVTYLLDFFKRIAQYSVPPTTIGWASSISGWISGNYAQQYHLNNWPFGLAAKTGIAKNNEALKGLARASEVAPMPYGPDSSKGDSWLFEPTPDGHHVWLNGTNTPGAKRWLKWLYGDKQKRTASLYAAEPTRFVPNYKDVITSDTFKNFSLFQQFPELLNELRFIQNTIVGEHYGQVPAADLNSPIALYVTRQWFYGEMVNRVITGTNTVQEAYDWGRQRLKARLQEARNKFPDA